MYVVVPIKRFAQAKSRLRWLLRDCERREFAALMAADVLRAVAAAKTVAGIAVVTDDPAAMSLGVSVGSEVIQEPGATGLSEVMGYAFACLRARGIADLMYLPADVPLVTSARIDSLTRHRTEGLALVSAQRDGGTNALMLTGDATLEFSFGPGSCRRHASQALHTGVSVRTLGATEIQCDIDTPEDFISLARATVLGGQSQRFARDILQRQLGGQPDSKYDIPSALS